MPSSFELTFRVEIPVEPASAHPVCIAWINKHGLLKECSIKDAVHILNFITNKHSYQHSLQRSIRLALTKNGLGELCYTVHVYYNKQPVATRKQLEARVTQLEDSKQPTEARIAQLERTISASTTTNITNIIVLQNFGNEDMSYLQNPTEYLEKTFEGMRTLMKDIYFNDAQTQNHTIRLNMATKKAEMHSDGVWKAIAMPVAKDRMIGNCRTYLIKGFNPEVHKNDDDIMNFTSSLGKEKTTSSLHTVINDGLLERNNRAVEAIASSHVPMPVPIPESEPYVEPHVFPHRYTFESVT